VDFLCLILTESILGLDWEKYEFLFGLRGIFTEAEEADL